MFRYLSFFGLVELTREEWLPLWAFFLQAERKGRVENNSTDLKRFKSYH
jgi:hypothetical protein